MERENVCTPEPDDEESLLHQPCQDSSDHKWISGEQESNMLDETEMQIDQTQQADQDCSSSNTDFMMPEGAEEWAQSVWEMRPVSCTSPPFSFATVEWDMPDPSAETPQLMTDSSLANELHSGGGMTVRSASPSLHRPQDINAELFTQDDEEEHDAFDSWLLISDAEWTAGYAEPCDSADVKELKTQEKEDSAHELLHSNNEISPRAESEEGDGRSVASDLVETFEEIQGLEYEVDAFVDVKPEEEQDVLLTGQEDSNGEPTLANGVETEEESEEGNAEEEQGVTDVSSDEESEESVGSLTAVDVSAEPLEGEDLGLTTTTDELIDLQEPDLLKDSGHSGAEEDAETLERLHENLTVEIAGSGMCEDEDRNVAHQQPDVADNNKETLIQEVEDSEKIENSPEGLEVNENLEETICLEQQECDQTASQESVVPLQRGHPEPEQPDMIEKPERMLTEVSHELGHQLEQSLQLDPSSEIEMGDQSTRLQQTEHPEDSALSEQTVSAEAEEPGVTSQPEQMGPSEQDEESLQMTDSPQQTLSEQPVQTERSDESEMLKQLSSETEVRQQTEEADLHQVDKQADMLDPAEDFGDPDGGVVERVVGNGEQHKTPDTAEPYMNGQVDREKARRLAERLFKLDGIQRTDVVKHTDKDNDFSRAVGEEYLKFFDFTGQTLDHALRSFLKVVILIGETQERERVLQHFSSRFHHCNPTSFSSLGAVLALTCALMLLNTDLHGQHVGKSMSSSKFVSNLDGMNEGENFSKDLLKSLYNSIKSEALEWAVDEQELKTSVLLEESAGDAPTLRSKANPFQDVPVDKKASVMKQGFLQRKLHADIDGKRTPWGKRGWKTFYGVLRGMVLYLQKDNYRSDQQTYEEVVSVHHSLAEQAANYTKKPHVFRLQTADWRVFLFQASSKVEMNSWISRINLVSALQSSPPFPAAVGSQRRFFRPILPASQSAHTLERQLQSHTGMLNSFKADLSHQQENPPEGKKTKARDLEEHRVRAEYLHHEVSRYEIYIQVLEAWQSVKTDKHALSNSDLNLFDKTVCEDTVGEKEEEEGGLKKSHSSPSLELEIAPPAVIKVRRNISERRTYRKTIVPRMKKEV
ncbi:PH and SEC7 domain-containing protein 4 [Cololabis saira]|uniref:PH and SEC7 domain-containing protein 4 n=1 Tax=Cololabis saira TaxID=129043 RepID=UPI002AD34A83|nr:PH and SEC7 domain-containing protein 4 [Cololabis saira]XP_061590096.1 PH and SEC7 domain-containing protein 4 [Cololabis saira]